jgi:ubiquinone/menaquinone biosynthesis C-methylase UbiE
MTSNNITTLFYIRAGCVKDLISTMNSNVHILKKSFSNDETFTQYQNKIQDFITYLNTPQPSHDLSDQITWGESLSIKAKDFIQFQNDIVKIFTPPSRHFLLNAIKDDIAKLLALEAAVEKQILQNEIITIYGNNRENWGDLGIFAGLYINFGYWKNIDITKLPLSDEQRKQSSYELYQYTIKSLKPSKKDIIVELGCGRGIGILQSFDCQKVQKVQGFDITPAQIEKANQVQRTSFSTTSPCIKFITSPLDNLPINPQSIDKVYAVEVLQHITDFSALATEIRRILKPGGIFTFVGDFSTSEENQKKLKHEKLLISDIEILTAIDTVKKSFSDQKFEIYCEDPIGKHIFEGYKTWVNQTHQQQTISYTVFEATNKIFEAHDKGYIDYYACTFISSSEPLTQAFDEL